MSFLKSLNAAALAFLVLSACTNAPAQGGAHMVLEVDVQKIWNDRLDDMEQAARTAMRHERIAYHSMTKTDGRVSLHIIDAARGADAQKALQETVETGITVSLPQPNMLVVEQGAAWRAQLHDEIMTQSVEIVSRRIAQLGIASPSVAADGASRIRVDIPALDDLQKLRDAFDLRSLEIRLVDDKVTEADIRARRVPAGEDIIEQSPSIAGAPPPPLAVYRDVIVSGDRIADAQQALDQRIGGWNVVIRFDGRGAAQFADVTTTHVGRRLALVLGDRVLSAPYVMDPILGGEVVISGNFTEAQAAQLAVELRAGAFPAPLKIVELTQTQ